MYTHEVKVGERVRLDTSDWRPDLKFFVENNHTQDFLCWLGTSSSGSGMSLHIHKPDRNESEVEPNEVLAALNEWQEV